MNLYRHREIAILIFLILKTKIHPFLGMVISASITGLVGGMSASNVVNSITTGFGVMMEEIFEVSGAAKKWHKYSLKSIYSKTCSR